MWLRVNLKVYRFLVPYLPYTNRCKTLKKTNMNYLKYLLIIAFVILMGCKENTKEQKTKTVDKTETEVENTNIITEDMIYFAGTWSGPDNYPMLELSIENGKYNVKECYGIDAENGTIYQAKYIESKVIALGNEKDFYKWTLPTFEFMSANADTLVFNSGVGSVKLNKTNLKMPNITYSASKDND